MDSQLFTLSKIFTERLLRIPDYQRGYAWTEEQLTDFWNDLQQIEKGSNHYTGVLTLETTPPETHNRWVDDSWIIESKGFEPFFVVDGQQRLTTAIILIQAIIECVEKETLLNYSSVDEIKKKFIFDTKDKGISRSYIFGYEKDNPSYEYLKTNIFQEFSSSSRAEETIYTNNLEKAKKFFHKCLAGMPVEEIEGVYRKVTQHLLFNIFTISEEVDVCVAFETMNNRGKALSDLELLKNRLIFLSVKIDEPQHERTKLRASINDCWKAIYHSLGRNKERPLDDDDFLSTHFFLYFYKQNNMEEDFISFGIPFHQQINLFQRGPQHKRLLTDIFVQRRIHAKGEQTPDVQIHNIYDYVSSLQKAANCWYTIFNSTTNSGLGDVGTWLDKLDRLGTPSCRPLLLALLLRCEKSDERIKVLRALERYIFIVELTLRGFMRFEEVDLLELAALLYDGKYSAGQVVTKLNEAIKSRIESPEFLSALTVSFEDGGFYRWVNVRYFLFEYNLHLQSKSKTERQKLIWGELTNHDPDYISVEHIYPQKTKIRYWTDRFPDLTTRQRELLRLRTHCSYPENDDGCDSDG